MPEESLWRHSDFMKLWAGQTISALGSVVTRTAIPLVALLILGAGPFEMALLVVAASLATLLVGFFAGAWVDRLSRRPVLIATDLARALLLLSIPVAYRRGRAPDRAALPRRLRRELPRGVLRRGVSRRTCRR